MSLNKIFLYVMFFSVLVQSAELLDRGLIAVPKSDGSVYVGWRMLENDPSDIIFDVFRQAAAADPVLLATVDNTTDFVDTAPLNADADYFIISRGSGIAAQQSKPVTVSNNQPVLPYISIPIKLGVNGFMQPTFGDLDGDGSLEILVKNPDSYLTPDDSGWHTDTRSYSVYAYKMDGTLMWEADLTRALEMGPWYAPMLVYDFNGDGRAEVALKTGPFINDEIYEPITDADGRVIDDEEYLSIIDGVEGEVVAETDWLPRGGYVGYNQESRNLMGVAYLDGENPSIIIVRGTYGLIKMAAYDYIGDALVERWRWSSTQETEPGYHGDGSRNGSGSHFIHAADVDNDGKDEIVYGSFVIDDDGHGLWALERQDNGRKSPGGHADGHYIGDIDPSHDGLEIYYQFEKWQNQNGMCLVDAATGNLLWGLADKSGHFHDAGLCADISADHPGMECYGLDQELSTDSNVHAWLFASDGSVINSGNSQNWGLQPWAVYWDADVERELILDESIVNYPSGNTVFSMQGCGRTIMVADIVGDWREEIIRSTSSNEIRVYTTTIPATDKRPTLMQDHIYRLDVAHNAIGYAQAPMLSKVLVAGSHNNTSSVKTGSVIPTNFELDVSPNPFSSHTFINLKAAKGQTSPLYIYSITGQLVKTIQPSSSRILWDGTNEFGLTAPAGIYLLRFMNGTNLQVGKIVKIH